MCCTIYLLDLDIHIIISTIFSLDLQCGVVVDVGHGVATSSVVWNREMCNSADCSPSEATPEKLASLVEGVIQKFTKNKATISLLRDHVVLTGISYSGKFLRGANF